MNNDYCSFRASRGSTLHDASAMPPRCPQPLPRHTNMALIHIEAERVALSLFYQIIDDDKWRKEERNIVCDVKIHRRGETPDLRRFKKLERLNLSGKNAYSVIAESKFPSSLKWLSAIDIGPKDKKTIEQDQWYSREIVTKPYLMIPYALGQLKHLEYLDLSNSNIYGHLHIGKLTSLKALKLRGCGIWALPDSFANLINLEELDLSQNQFMVVPKCMGSMKALKTLLINNNNLSNFPIIDFPRLEHLDISGNSFDKFPHAVSKLTSLMFLNISRCRFDSVDIYNLVNLKVLTLFDSGITDLQTIPSLPHLELIKIRFGTTQKIPDVLIKQHLHGLLKIVNDKGDTWANVKNLGDIKIASLQDICIKRIKLIKDLSMYQFPSAIERQLGA